MKKILLSTLLLIVSAHASAAFYSTAYLMQLLDSCNALPETFDATAENISRIKDCGLSTGYILAIYDASNVMADRSKCPPRTLQSEQAVRVVGEWIKNHPEQWNASADHTIESALSDAWSCPN